MEVIADLHLHSKYSRAVSQNMIIPQISLWAAKKGIGLVGTADFTHPLWFRELKENLKEVGEGVYRAKNPPEGRLNPLFLLTTEISSIYTQEGRSHRIHNLILAPNLNIVEEINNKLRSRGVNLMSDGRPISGLSTPQICEIVFSVSNDCLVIPAHIWTPWYSLYGSNSGFDSIKECFGEFADQIKAIETGLSSDPAMNWRITELDKRSILSFSDAHSTPKLGREATVFEVEDVKKLKYEDIRQAIINNKIAYTIEFYPEEGKYHWTGHRLCQVKQSPEQTAKLGTICPVCGRKLTVGVMHRVEELASRPDDYRPENRPPYFMIVPLLEILAEVMESSVSSQVVIGRYEQMLEKFGSEFEVLLKTPVEFIAQSFGEKTADAVNKVRKGQIFVDPGYDGVFGTVKIWSSSDEEEKKGEKEQMSLF
ncbi:DNA helicase UvrD [Candidatus Woesebacteria bacterium CG_4_10_14_0_2_um_filter_39_14]|uniref:DNA helicase UvrD n=3 Tax=Microgenomates group TaxID=1794810 RepID=A0A2M6YPT2_9BACT|nr:MAG: DNA helicase UvrD [Candidatus Shapirobacteria bacterium CG07_land_8_20_14_0_80_39_12]PIZ50083.1 MAG: DNA helicase UvrD [Candidatus Woesebacteria bacterium CG_4_10_14_0_2_um_filter_39_14]PJA49392.1 MAG: DNA helicase UvrD [Candidatus Shapirobacteria bacterium CG_4_9_14_3_um_filter_39_13]